MQLPRVIRPPSAGVNRNKFRHKFNEKWAIKLWNAQEHKCFICGEWLRMPGSDGRDSGEMPTLDHVVPLNLGGPHDRRNITLTHKRCNNARGNSPPGPGDIQRCLNLWRRIDP